jgi:hypothetical protein
VSHSVDTTPLVPAAEVLVAGTAELNLRAVSKSTISRKYSFVTWCRVLDTLSVLLDTWQVQRLDVQCWLSS